MPLWGQYGSFVIETCAGRGSAEFCARAIEAHVEGALKGRLRTIEKKAA